MSSDTGASDNGASVEEILESIKKVMERDSRASGAGARKPKKSDFSGENLPSKSNDMQEDEILDLTEMELEEFVETNEQDENADQPLIGDEVRGAMQENLAALAMLSEPPAKPQIVRSGETSLESLTRELLRPMLAEWLDKNLPDMVEKMVQAEIARIAGKRG